MQQIATDLIAEIDTQWLSHSFLGQEVQVWLRWVLCSGAVSAAKGVNAAVFSSGAKLLQVLNRIQFFGGYRTVALGPTSCPFPTGSSQHGWGFLQGQQQSVLPQIFPFLSGKALSLFLKLGPPRVISLLINSVSPLGTSFTSAKCDLLTGLKSQRFLNPTPSQMEVFHGVCTPLWPSYMSRHCSSLTSSNWEVGNNVLWVGYYLCCLYMKNILKRKPELASPTSPQISQPLFSDLQQM